MVSEGRSSSSGKYINEYTICLGQSCSIFVAVYKIIIIFYFSLSVYMHGIFAILQDSTFILYIGFKNIYTIHVPINYSIVCYRVIIRLNYIPRKALLAMIENLDFYNF